MRTGPRSPPTHRTSTKKITSVSSPYVCLHLNPQNLQIPREDSSIKACSLQKLVPIPEIQSYVGAYSTLILKPDLELVGSRDRSASGKSLAVGSHQGTKGL